MKGRKYSLAVTCLLAIMAVAVVPSCGIYKINIQQGNFIDDDKLEQLKIGMTRRQVEFLLGTPAIQDPFHADRWDYVFYFRNGRTRAVQQRNVVVLFDGDTVEEIVIPAEDAGSA